MILCRWEWGLDCQVWQEALAHHYQHNPHHPQYCPGQSMEQRYLEESVLDMLGKRGELNIQLNKSYIACNWERGLGGSETALVEDILHCKDIYLERYLPEDRRKVKDLLNRILKRYGSIV